MTSEIGVGDLFAERKSVPGSSNAGTAFASGGESGNKRASGIVVTDTNIGAGWGRGPVPQDPRRFRYDRLRGKSLPRLGFQVSRADRMDADEAGATLDRVHQAFNIDKEDEARLYAFDSALFFQHTLNGASMLQEDSGTLHVDGVDFDIGTIVRIIGIERQRKFFRAFADEIAEVNRVIAGNYDPYNIVTAEQYGMLMQVATKRGLHRYPHLAHDSADAGTNLTLEERRALLASKQISIPEDNAVDKVSVGARGIPPDKAIDNMDKV